MSDPSFDHQLARLFAEPPGFADQAAFAAAVQARLDRGWAMRRVMIGAAGGVGGLIAAAQVVGANLVRRAAAASQSADVRAHDLFAELLARSQSALHVHTLSAHTPPLGGEAVWMVAGLAAVGLGLLAARLMEAL